MGWFVSATRSIVKRTDEEGGREEKKGMRDHAPSCSDLSAAGGTSGTWGSTSHALCRRSVEKAGRDEGNRKERRRRRGRTKDMSADANSGAEDSRPLAGMRTVLTSQREP